MINVEIGVIMVNYACIRQKYFIPAPFGLPNVTASAWSHSG